MVLACEGVFVECWRVKKLIRTMAMCIAYLFIGKHFIIININHQFDGGKIST